jgi:PAS domain S-box-containing protein
MSSHSTFPVSVLCVDDEPVNLDILKLILASRIDTMYVATNGQEGYDLFLEHRPDIVMSDLVMPEIDGLDMSRMIRAIDPKVPIILLTGCIAIDSLIKAIDNGITQFLPKPILKDNLLNAIARCYETIDLERRFKKEHERAQLLASALEHSTTAIIILDSDGTVEHLNLASRLMYGWSSEAMLGRSLLSCDTSPGLHRLVGSALATTEPGSGEIEISWHTGENSSAMATISPFGSTQSDLKYLISLEDITEKKSTEAHLLRTQKLESLGVLAGGVAHNFNNILTAIIGNTSLAMMKLSEDSPALKFLKNIEISAIRAADIAKQMLDYSGKGAIMLAQINLNDLLKNMQDMLEVPVPKTVAITFAPAETLRLVSGDAAQLRQVVMNLVINAAEAIDTVGTGTIRISTGSMECGKAYLATCWYDNSATVGEYVFIEVSDSGCGMDKETIAKLFDPFYTTKFTGRGLGMAAVLGIVRWHNGAIHISSKPGAGSTFRILLPAVPDSDAPSPGGRHA